MTATVTLKRKDEKVGSFGYADVLPHLKAELDRLLAEHRFDDAGLAWLTGLQPAHAGPERMAVAARG